MACAGCWVPGGGRGGGVKIIGKGRRMKNHQPKAWQGRAGVSGRV